MRVRAALVTPLLLLAACGGPADDVATDPGSRPSVAPDAVPAAPGEVYTRDLVTVVDAGPSSDGPELCVGAILDSYPPQCGDGLPVADWDWAALDLEQGDYSKSGSIRFGSFRVRGTWDGATLGLTSATPAARLAEVPLETPTPTLPTPPVRLDDDELTGIGDTVGGDLPGVQSVEVDDAGHVLVDVTYDDGTLQRYVDATYGTDVVLLDSLLVDSEG